MLTANVQRTVEIPHEPGERMTFRQLSWLQLAEAEEVRSAHVMRNLRNMGGDLLRDLQGIQRPEEVAPPKPADLLGAYDRRTLLCAGIVGWSYPEPCTPENIDTLDPQTADWAALQIVDQGRPPDIEVQTRNFTSSASTSTESLTLTLQPNGSLA